MNAIRSLLAGLADASRLVPSGEWIPEDHLDRLAQYDLFRRLDEGGFSALLLDREAGAKFREYGDIGLIVDTSRDAVLGDAFGIEVPGSNDPENPGAAARLTLLETWAERERYASKLYQGESDAALVGDSVYELRADGTRLRLKVHEPEAFFPVWDSVDGDFSEAYVAWEEPNNGQWPGAPDVPIRDLRNAYGDVVLFRRHYWKVPAAEAPEGIDPAGRSEIALVSGGWYRIDNLDARASSLDQFSLIAYELDSAGQPLEAGDTGFDEIPLFYVPNIETTRQPWGLAECHRVVKILIDASLDQTDMRENTRYSAFPLVYDKRERAAGRIAPGTATNPRSSEPYKPGQIYNDRDLGMLDFSNGNKVLLEHERFLIEKALSNSRTTTIAAGLISTPGDVPSGLALTIALLPLIQKTMPKRQTRKDKLGMLLKHVLRWHRENGNPADFFSVVDVEERPGEAGGEPTRIETRRAAGEWPAGIWDDDSAYPTFGAIIPFDKKQTSEIVRDLLNADAISQETATLILQAAGFPIDDAAEEVERIAASRQPPVGAAGSGFGREGVPIPGLTGPGEAET